MKFRAYDEPHKEMRYSEIHDGEFYVNTKGVLYMYKKPDSDTGDDKIDYYKNYDVMVCSELEDMTGKEIWEGDIVQRGVTIPGITPDLHQIIFENGCFMMSNISGISFSGNSTIGIRFVMSAYIKELSVIGNIHEDPELMEAANA